MNTWKTDLGHNWFLLKRDLNDDNCDGPCCDQTDDCVRRLCTLSLWLEMGTAVCLFRTSHECNEKSVTNLLQ